MFSNGRFIWRHQSVSRILDAGSFPGSYLQWGINLSNLLRARFYIYIGFVRFVQFFNLFKLSFQVRDDRRKQSDVSEEGGTSSESPPRDIISDQVNYFAEIAHFFWNFWIFLFLLQGSLKIIQTKMFSLPHLILTGLHMLQMTLAYFLMLIVMTYNSWLCGAVILGSTLGYFCFGWRKTSIVDVSDHCHWRLFQGKIWKSQKYSFKVKIV